PLPVGPNRAPFPPYGSSNSNGRRAGAGVWPFGRSWPSRWGETLAMDAKANLKNRLPSRHVTEGPERAPHRSYYYAMGLTTAQIHQPFVGVASCWNEAAPCNISLMRQAQAAKKGVAAAGGTPREFCTITVTDGLAMGQMSDADLDEIERVACPSAGACGAQFTANTMATVSEAIGLALPYSAGAPAPYEIRDAFCTAAGEKVMELIALNLRPRDIVT